MSWGEAVRLVGELCRDPTTHIATNLAGWEFPVSHEWMLLLSIREGYMAAHAKDPKPWSITPWSSGPEHLLTQEQIDAELARMNVQA